MPRRKKNVQPVTTEGFLDMTNIALSGTRFSTLSHGFERCIVQSSLTPHSVERKKCGTLVVWGIRLMNTVATCSKAHVSWLVLTLAHAQTTERRGLAPSSMLQDERCKPCTWSLDRGRVTIGKGCCEDCGGRSAVVEAAGVDDSGNCGGGSAIAAVCGDGCGNCCGSSCSRGKGGSVNTTLVYKGRVLQQGGS